MNTDKSSSHKPPQHNAVSPYLLVRDGHRMLAFLTEAFGAEEIHRSVTPEGRIKHAEVRIDDSVVMLGEQPDADADGHAHCAVHVYVPDVDACYQKALGAGASTLMAPSDQSYGDRSAGVRDHEGHAWWLATYIERTA